MVDGGAGVAQLVEHDVANVVVVGSNPITRSLATHGKSRNVPVSGYGFVDWRAVGFRRSSTPWRDYA